LLARGKKDQALEVVKVNQQRHPQEKFWTYLGLAQAYTATGDKANAIRNWEIALQNVPQDSKTSIPDYEKTLEQLKKSL
jgi:tetratricopeptide (TPR) repeat protein